MNISQSIIKSIIDKQCPKLMKHTYIDGNYSDNTSGAMHLGCYFEYCMTGALPKNGKVPEPVRLKKGDLSKPYALAKERAATYKEIIQDLGFKILDSGVSMKKNGLSGTMDIIAEYKNKIVIIDLKYSGLIGNKWETFGWHDDTISSNMGHLIQAHHYQLVSSLDSDLEPWEFPFFFFIVGSAAKENVKIYEIKTNEYSHSNHLNLIDHTRDELKRLEEDGWKPEGNYAKCKECPLFDTCDGAVKLPEIVAVELD